METMDSYNLVEHVYGLAVAHDCPRGFESGAIFGAKLGAMKPGEVGTIVMGSTTSPTFIARLLTEGELCGFETVALVVTKARKLDEYHVARIR